MILHVHTQYPCLISYFGMKKIEQAGYYFPFFAYKSKYSLVSHFGIQNKETFFTHDLFCSCIYPKGNDGNILFKENPFGRLWLNSTDAQPNFMVFVFCSIKANQSFSNGIMPSCRKIDLM